MSGWGGWDSEIPSNNKNNNNNNKKNSAQQQQQQKPQQIQQKSYQAPQSSSSSSGYKPRFIKSDPNKLSEKQKLKQEIIDNDKGEKDIIFRSKKGVFLSECYMKSQKDDTQEIIPQVADYMCISQNGQIGLFAGTNYIVSINLQNKQVLGELKDLKSVQNISISKTEKYMQFVDRQAKDIFSIQLMTFPELKLVKSFEDRVFVKENFPPVKMTDDDSLAFKYHYQKQVINVFQFAEEKVNVLRQFKVGIIDHFEVAPQNLKNPIFNTVFLEKQSGFEVKQGTFNIYEVQKDKPVISKILDKAQEVTPVWASDGLNLLLKVESMSDKTNQSYYGENRLFHYNTLKKEFTLVPTFKGPVQDFQWSPDNKNFCVISGFMPAHTVLFSKDGKPQFEFGTHHRNRIFYSNLNRFMALAGFGNLNGEIDIWDLKQQKKIGSCESSSAYNCNWSNDGRKFMTSVVTPKLRVENNFKVFKYDGTLIHKSDFNDTELYEVTWSTHKNTQKYEDRPPSPKSQQKKEEEEQKKQEEPKFSAQGGGSFAEQLRQMKQSEQNDKCRVIKSDKDFGGKSMQGATSNLKPGQQADLQDAKPKKKRIRKKDMQKMMEGLKDEGDNL